MAAEANCFLSALPAGALAVAAPAGLGAVLGQDFWATRMLVPMKVGAFLGASPERTARAALGVREKVIGVLHALDVFHEGEVALAERGRARVSALLGDGRVDRADDEEIVQRGMIA